MYYGRPNTIELRNCVSTPQELFDFDYKFYTEDIEVKKEFEELFYNEYFFREIGQETYQRFKQMLKQKLNIKMKLYKQLYQSEIEAYEVGWLTQKDLKDTFEREVDGIVNQESESTDTTNSTNTSKNDSFFSDTPSSKIDDIEQYMSNASRDKATNNADINSTSKGKGTSNNKTIEKTTYHSTGQVGIQTVAQPVQWWREQMININEMLIDEFKDLFFLLY